MTVTFQQVADTYGILNDISPPDGLSGDRRTLTPTDALSAVLEQAFSPDALGGKTIFTGVVMATLPTNEPTFTSFSDSIDYLNSVYFNSGGAPQGVSELFFVYKVYIPEIDPRQIIISNRKRCKGLSFSQRVNSLPTAVLAAGEGTSRESQAIIPGTLVDIRFENEKRFLHPKIIRIGGKVFNVNYKKQSVSQIFRANGPVLMNPGGKVSTNDPGYFSWSNRAKQLKGNYAPTGQEVGNGDLSDTIIEGGVNSGEPLLWTDSDSGAQLILDAKEDWLKLTAAYKAKFPGKKIIVGGGYRDYDGQVRERMRRVAGDRSGCTERLEDEREPDGEGSGERNKNCGHIGKAATPGQSNHGWGAAVDIDRTKSGWTKKRGENSPEFKWMNKHAERFNFTAEVRNEFWHFSWTKINKTIVGPTYRGLGTKWNKAGLNEDIPFGPPAATEESSTDASAAAPTEEASVPTDPYGAQPAGP